MKIEKAKTGVRERLTFEMLESPNLFGLLSSVEGDFYEDSVFMKIEEIEDSGHHKYNAIRLYDGELASFDEDELVVEFTGILTVREVLE